MRAGVTIWEALRLSSQLPTPTMRLFLVSTASVPPPSNTLERRKLCDVGWDVMKCRFSVWRAWLSIAKYRGKDLVDNYCLLQEGVVYWLPQRWAALPFLLTPRAKRWPIGTRATVRYH